MKMLFDENQVDPIWKVTIMKDKELKSELKKILETINSWDDDEASFWKQRIFRPLSSFVPGATKVIIIGQDPMALNPTDQNSIAGNSNGLSFSADVPDHMIAPTNCQPSPGHSIWIIHEALKEAGILKDKSYRCDHLEWLDRGVLLLNCALTVGAEPKSHLEMWENFMVKLLDKLLWDIIIMNEEEPAHVIEDHFPEDYPNFTSEKMFKWFEENKKFHDIYIILFGWEAKDLWDRVFDNSELKQLLPKSNFMFHVRKFFHPSYRNKDERMYLEKLAEVFQEVNARYPGIFNITEEQR